MSSPHANRRYKLLLLVGYLALAVGVLLVRRNPAREYQLGIYQSTPPGLWVGVGVALAAAVVASLWATGDDRTRTAASLLGVLAALTVFSLPIHLGYFFYGEGDSLSHLGWTTEILNGSLSPLDLLYPGIHTVSAYTAVLTGLPLSTAVMLVVLVFFPLVYLLVVPLCVDLVSGRERAFVVGSLSALLLLPINNVSVHPNAHPTGQAIFFAPAVLYVAYRYAVTRADGEGRVPRGALVALFAVLAAGVVLTHPQQSLNVVLVLAAGVATQLVVPRLRPDHPVAGHRSLLPPLVVIVGVFATWAPRHSRVSGATTSIFQSILFDGITTGDAVGARDVSLATLGGSLPELFVKLFLPSLVFVLLAGALAVAVVLGRTGRDHRGAVALYLVAALVPLGMAFLVFFAASSGDQYFRYVGFTMVPVTILGGVALTNAIDRIRGDPDGATDRPGARASGGPRDRRLTALVVVLFLLVVPLALLALHPSPYMYQPSGQVPESHLQGYANSFEHRAADVEFTGIRGGPRRYVDAYYGTNTARFALDFPGYEDGVPEAVFNEATYTSAYPDDRYLVVTQRAYDREAVLYEGFRYTTGGFDALGRTPGVDRVRANGGFELYYVDAGADG